MEVSLREIAHCEGGCFFLCDPRDPEWHWTVEPFDVSRVVGRQWADPHYQPYSLESWREWLDNEIKHEKDPGYFADMREALKQDTSSCGEIILAVFSDGNVEVGDGWHRLAIAICEGIPTLPAIIGRRYTRQ